MKSSLLGSDGRAVIVALDHALASGQVAPLDQPAQLLGHILPSQPDGLIVTYGMHKLVPETYSGQCWLTADYYATSVFPGKNGDLELQDLIWSVKAAQALGVAGLKILLVFGRQDPRVQLRNVGYVADLVGEAHQAKLPVMVEPVLWGSQIPIEQQSNPELVVHAARVAFELGADVVKVPIPDDPRALERLARALPIPIVLMGGPPTDPSKLFGMLREAMDAGAAGVALGRNIWQHADPAAMVRALKQMVHHGSPPKEALELLKIGGQA